MKKASLTLLANNFGDFNFRQKKCPKIKPFELFNRRKFQTSEVFTVQCKTLGSYKALSFLYEANSS